MTQLTKKVSIIGGGPAGLLSALRLLEKGYSVQLFEYKANIARKFLVAGHGGLNLTHSESLKPFTSRYYKNESLFKKLLDHFSPADYRKWLLSLGIETYIGTSKRVFPKDKSAKEIVFILKEKLESFEDFSLYTNSKLVDLNSKGHFTITSGDGVKTYTDQDALILAMGGASWTKTGSDANWISTLKKNEVEVIPFTPMNCGYHCNWSDYISKTDSQIVLKNIEVKIKDQSVRGEAIVTSYGIEGSGIYALNHLIKEDYDLNSKSEIFIDLKPDLEIDEIIKRLNTKNTKTSLINHLRKSLNLNKDIFSLLREKLDANQIKNNELLANTIKDFRIILTHPRPIEEAISSSGGIAMNELDEDLKLKKIKNTYAIGEMLDWDAPTGGYLLQGCFSMANFVSSKI